jgi:mono/diheme cytochrome c family protein
VDTGEILLIALIILGPAALLWVVFLARNRPRNPAASLGIPKAMRPGQPDEVLEGPRLQRIQAVGVVATLATALFIPAYWLPENQRQEAFAEHQQETSIERGHLIYSEPPPLEEAEGAGPQRFKEVEEAIALGQNCIACHGPEGTGGQVPFGYIDPVLGRQVDYVAPPLNNVFTRWDEEVVRFTIERGRPGTPMPAWGVDYGGPMTDMMVEDVMNWLRSLPENQTPPELPEGCEEPEGDDVLRCGEEIFAARCAVCHGPQGQGKDADPYYQGMALWQGKVRHLTRGQHLFTVQNGRRFAFMPQFSEAPAQGIPVPPYPLTDAQIEAVVEYERSL